MRIDKFIWAVRLFKSRSVASKACLSEQVKINNSFFKPSKPVSVGAIISIKSIPIWRTYKVIDFPKSRVGAKLVADYIIETTPEEELRQLNEIQEANRQNKFLGIKGRPTKKVRRDLDNLLD
ncbi:MAG: S4 domain-containing protein [Vicingaceae bacterium]|jgi:ribosome-associated heat shock protein Hsp15